MSKNQNTLCIIMRSESYFFLFVILLCVFCMSCKSEIKTIEVKIQALKKNGYSMSNIEVKIFKEEDRLFSMKNYIVIDSAKTDSKGHFKFKTRKKGIYSIRFYKDNDLGPFYWIDTLKIEDLRNDKFYKLAW